MNDKHKDEGDLHFEQIGHRSVQFEDRDLGAKGIIVFLLVLGITGVALCLMVWGYFSHKTRAGLHPGYQVPLPQEVAPGPSAEVQPPAERFPKPALQVDDAADFNQYREALTHRLDTYGYVDRSAGIVHIPIQQAMDQVLKQGIPVHPAPPPSGPVATFGSGIDTVAGAGGGVRPETQ